MVIALLLSQLAAADPLATQGWDEVAQTSGMSVDECKALMQGVDKDQSILDRMATPWERKPWHQYRAIFIKQHRIDKGVAFWNEHEAKLDEVAAATGVPAKVIVGILGVETTFGGNMGDDAVTTALYTLGFFHSGRGTFFRKELGHYLRLATDEGWDVHGRKGSYAGAMGMGQFIPSSYRNYAADGDGDGKRDLFGSTDDAIASIANYFVEHGWVKGGGTLLPAEGEAARLEALAQSKLGLDKTWGDLKQGGLTTEAALSDQAAAGVFAFDGADGPEYQVALHNFYVVTRYNHSKLYARVVLELADAVESAR